MNFRTSSKKDKINQEIIDRVFEESEKNREKDEQNLEEKIQIESLSEVSGLSKKRISEITKSVKAKYVTDKKKRKKFIYSGTLILLTAVCVSFVAISVINTILDKKEKQDRRSYVELLSAASSGNIDKIRELTKEWIEWDNKAFPYDSPLLSAALINDVNLIKYLIENGADVLKKDSSGKTALDLSYQTAFLKANFPVEFMASLLTSVMGNSDKVSNYISECLRMGIKVLPPCVNESLKIFTVVAEGVRFGLSADEDDFVA